MYQAVTFSLKLSNRMLSQWLSLYPFIQEYKSKEWSNTLYEEMKKLKLSLKWYMKLSATSFGLELSWVQMSGLY